MAHRLRIDDLIGTAGDSLRIVLDVAFPEANHSPSSLLKRACCSGIPRHVAGDLCHPVGSVCAGVQLCLAYGPIPSMPEIAVTKDYYPSTGKNYVRLTNHSVNVLAKS